jgi:hypothetical protein
VLNSPRLLSHKTQETYFNKIVDRYMEFCAAAGREDDKLDRAFASLNFKELDDKAGRSDPAVQQDWASAPREALDLVVSRTSASNPAAVDTPHASNELGVIMMAMRKLREGILASGRVDTFAQGVYIFITRAAILTSTYESYQPSLLHLLNRLHTTVPLSASELREFVGYEILDLACRLGQYNEAFATRHRWGFADTRVDAIVQAVVRDEWVTFWRLYGLVDGYQRRFMRWAEDGMRSHALKCLGRSYLSVDRRFVESSAHKPWKLLKEQDNVGWELEGDQVIVRRVKRK